MARFDYEITRRPGIATRWAYRGWVWENTALGQVDRTEHRLPIIEAGNDGRKVRALVERQCRARVAYLERK